MVKALLKRILPAPFRNFVTRVHYDLVLRPYASLGLAEAFDRIYASNAWEGGGAGTLSSGSGSTGKYVKAYCQILEPLLRAHNVRSVADLGCGNFNTGRHIASMVTRYTGVDIARAVIDANVRAFANDHISFIRADVTTDSLPPADVAIMRQVLQHLSNSEIMAALNNVLQAYRLVFVTEHVYVGPDSKPNLDITHGPGTRIPERSGVFIDQPPFSLDALLAGDLQYGPNQVLRTWILAGKR